VLAGAMHALGAQRLNPRQVVDQPVIVVVVMPMVFGSHA
jgi:hypothetical protein